MKPYAAFASDPVILVSDTHYRPGSRSIRTIIALAASRGAETLIVLGDLFDDLHRLLSASEVGKALRCIFKGARGLRVIFVTSLSSHDPILRESVHFKSDELDLHVYPGPVIAQLGGLTAFLTHGDLALRNGAQAFLINFLMKSLGKELFLEKALRQKLRLPADWWLFMGHTHIPGIDYEARVANTGSWRESWVLGIPYWRPPSNTYLFVESGRVELCQELFKAKRRGHETWLRKSVRKTSRR
ncbi:MAG: metallophosphoesterase family protein [Thermofilaceae archaeon]